MRYCKTILFTITILSSFVYCQQRIDGIAAVIGDEVILISDVNALVTQYALQNKINILEKPSLYQELSENFLQTLIDEKLLLIKADEDTIKADEERVEQTLNQQIDYVVSQVGSVEELERYYNAPIAKIKKDFRKQVENRFRIELLRQRRFGNVNISRREVEQFYSSYQDSIPTLPPTVNISHILKQIIPSEASVQEAFLKIENLMQRLDAGEDFAKLAEEFSEDPGSSSRGGDLGFVSRGDFVQEFEEAAFALNEGEISEIVRSQFGFHVIQLLERQGEKIHVRHILIQLKPTEKDEEIVIQKLNEIRDMIINDKDTFEEMALKYSDDPNVKQDNGNLGVFRTDAFQVREFETVTKSLAVGEISKPFKTEFGYHIVRLNERKQERTVSIDDDWEQIEQMALQNKKEEEFKKWLVKLREEIPIDIKVQI
jgi:peptidyl-prolyl cis-trans isomerase SurA